MSIAIIGGNDSMVGRYKKLCEERNCKAKVFTQIQGLKDKLGRPDLVVLFTGTVSHKMVHTAASVLEENTKVVRCHSSSVSALKKILDEYTA